jgi:hypothetical protein
MAERDKDEYLVTTHVVKTVVNKQNLGNWMDIHERLNEKRVVVMLIFSLHCNLQYLRRLKDRKRFNNLHILSMTAAMSFKFLKSNLIRLTQANK